MAMMIMMRFRWLLFVTAWGLLSHVFPSPLPRARIFPFRLTGGGRQRFCWRLPSRRFHYLRGTLSSQDSHIHIHIQHARVHACWCVCVCASGKVEEKQENSLRLRDELSWDARCLMLRMPEYVNMGIWVRRQIDLIRPPFVSSINDFESIPEMRLGFE